jgi:DNA-binding LytR/AlgR family response regulator
MKTWEVGIPQPPFVRVHRKALVNLRFFDRKVTRSDGEVMLVLKGDPEEIPVSIRRRGAVSRMLKEMKLSNES